MRKQQYNSYARTAHTTAIHAQRTTHSTQHTAHSTQHTVTELRKIKLSRVYMDSESIELVGRIASQSRYGGAPAP